jgi:hypothetical protein
MVIRSWSSVIGRGMITYRVHTIVVGRNMPVIVQAFEVKPAPLDAMPLLRLMLAADAEPLGHEVIQVIFGPTVRRATKRTVGSASKSSSAAKPPDATV